MHHEATEAFSDETEYVKTKDCIDTKCKHHRPQSGGGVCPEQESKLHIVANT
jgi:hypothetical protein